MVNVGELNQRIQILKITQPEDADGYPVRQERVVRTAWAKVSRPSGTEQIRSGAEVLQERIRFLIRWGHEPVNRNMVIRYRGNDYDIEFVNDYEDANRYVEIWCKRTTLEG